MLLDRQTFLLNDCSISLPLLNICKTVLQLYQNITTLNRVQVVSNHDCMKGFMSSLDYLRLYIIDLFLTLY